MYKHLKKRDEALESYRKCVALDPDNAAAHNNMGLIYSDKRDFENAIKEFEEILRIFPDHPTGLKNLELATKKIGGAEKVLLGARNIFECVKWFLSCHCARARLAQGVVQYLVVVHGYLARAA